MVNIRVLSINHRDKEAEPVSKEIILPEPLACL